MVLEAYRHVCKNMLSDLTLSQTMSAAFPAPDALMAFRTSFTKQIALSAFLSHMLSVGDRSPHRLLFSLETGSVVNSEFRPSYTSPRYVCVVAVVAVHRLGFARSHM